MPNLQKGRLRSEQPTTARIGCAGFPGVGMELELVDTLKRCMPVMDVAASSLPPLKMRVRRLGPWLDGIPARVLANVCEHSRVKMLRIDPALLEVLPDDIGVEGACEI